MLFRSLPDSLSDVDGAVLEPLGVAIHALDLAHLKSGMTVGVFGCGPIGLLVVQLVRQSGAVQVIATDKMTHRLEAANNYGADTVIQARDGAENAEILAAAGVLATARNLGMVLGVGLSGAIFNSFMHMTPAAAANLFTATRASFIVSAAIALLGIVTTFIRSDHPKTS